MEHSATASTKLFLAAGTVTLVAVAACQRGDAARPASTTTWSATIPAPQATVPTTRTIDNAGFVDNGGRTSDEVSRSQMSGMRATELGSERLTGTPGSGAPIPIEVAPPPPNLGEGRGAASSVRGTPARPQPSGAPPDELPPRIARARCDRETACDRVGDAGAYKTQRSCETQQRDRARDQVEALQCPRGVDMAQVGSCLNAIRLQPCGDERTAIDALPECAASALCAPPKGSPPWFLPGAPPSGTR